MKERKGKHKDQRKQIPMLHEDMLRETVDMRFTMGDAKKWRQEVLGFTVSELGALIGTMANRPDLAAFYGGYWAGLEIGVYRIEQLPPDVMAHILAIAEKSEAFWVQWETLAKYLETKP